MFDPYKIENCNLDREHLYKMSQYFGEIPIEIIQKSKRNKYLFEPNSNKVKKMPNLESISLKTIFMQYGMCEQDAKETEEFLLYICVFDIDKRPEFHDIINHNWLTK